MAEALFWGVLASSSLLVGGVIALRVRIPTGVLGLTMAFGAGVLISAVAYELVEEAFETAAGSGGVAVELALGSLAFFVGDLVIDRMGGADRKRSQASQAGRGTALAIVSPGPRYRCCSATSLPLSMAAARSARQRTGAVKRLGDHPVVVAFSSGATRVEIAASSEQRHRRLAAGRPGTTQPEERPRVSTDHR